MARPQHKHVLSSPDRVRPRLLRLGVAATTALVLAAPAAAVVWPDDEPVTAPAAGETARANPRVAPDGGVETWGAVEDEPSTVEGTVAAPLVVRSRPSDKARLVALDPSEQVVVTGETRGRWAEVVVDDQTRWVRRAVLADVGAEPGSGQVPRRRLQVAGRELVASGTDSKSRPRPAGTSTPGPTRAGAAAAPAKEAAPRPAPAASEPVPPSPEVSVPTSEPTSAPPASVDEPLPAWDPTPDAEPTPEAGPTPEAEPTEELTEELTQDPVVETGPPCRWSPSPSRGPKRCSNGQVRAAARTAS